MLQLLFFLQLLILRIHTRNSTFFFLLLSTIVNGRVRADDMYFTRLQQEHTAAKNMKRHLLKSGKKRDPVATGIHNWEFNLEIFWGKSRPETMPAIYGFKSLNHVKLAYCRSNHFNLCSKILCLQLSYLLAASKIQSYFSNGVLNSLVLYLQLFLGWTIGL